MSRRRFLTILVGSWTALVMAFSGSAFAYHNWQTGDYTHKTAGFSHGVSASYDQHSFAGGIMAYFQYPNGTYDARAVACLYREGVRMGCQAGRPSGTWPYVWLEAAPHEIGYCPQYPGARWYAKFEISTWSNPQSGNIMPGHTMYLCNPYDYK